MNDSESLRTSEIIPLYALLRERQDDMHPALHALTSRIERRLFESLSIDEIESITMMSDADIEALSKKL